MENPTQYHMTEKRKRILKKLMAIPQHKTVEFGEYTQGNSLLWSKSDPGSTMSYIGEFYFDLTVQ